MSANDDFGTDDDLDALLSDPKPPTKKPAAKKAPAAAPTPRPEPTRMADEAEPEEDLAAAPPAAEPQAPAVTLDVLKSLLENLKDDLRDDLRREFAPPVHREIPATNPPPLTGNGTNGANVTWTTNATNLPASRVLNADTAPAPVDPTIDADPAEGTIIHFLDDGLTIGGHVFYRGQEYVAPKDAKWAQMSHGDQIRRFGKRYFDQGPWTGVGYDLSDPSLNQSDRERLAEIADRQTAALAAYR